MMEKAEVMVRREDGAAITFSSDLRDPVRLNHGAKGLGIAPVQFDTEAVLAGHGSVLRGSRLTERDILVPLMLEARSNAALDGVRDDLMRLLSPLDPSPLWLRVTAPESGTYREMRVYYAGGLEGDFGSSYWGRAQKVALEFKALDALWSGEPEVLTKRVKPAVQHFLSTTQPFFPVRLSSALVSGTLDVTVTGDAPTAPMWSITPPGEELMIKRRETGERFYLAGRLTAPLEIDMAEGRVEDTSGNDLWERVSLDSRLFELPPGPNRLEFTMINATEASAVTVTYRPRYLAAL